MKTLLSSTLLAATLATAHVGLDPAPAAAATLDAGRHLAGQGLFADDGAAPDTFDRRGRGRGRGGDDRHGGDDDHGGDDHGGRGGHHGGGHGADDGAGHDAGDDHGGARDDDRRGGRRPRVPGGSGCDDPWDVIEHPECQVPVAP